jgi:Ca-activated chloride channel family protein
MSLLKRWRPALVAACVLALLPPAAGAQPHAGSEQHVARTLAPYFAVDAADPGIEALPLKSTRADVTVSGMIAEVRLTQVYRNEGATPIEARYVFPASTRAAVHALRLRIGSRVIDAEVREKRKARAEYQQARREGRSAALLEQQRPNVFSMAIAHVMPGDEIVADLRYTETIVPTDGVYRFVLPTVVGPRYNGGTQPDGAPSASRKPEGWVAQPVLRFGQPPKHTFELAATIVAPMPIRSVSSTSHRIEVTGLGETRATVRLAADRTHADRDVVIDYRLASDRIEAGVLVHRDPGGGENFFLAMVEPPARVATADIVARDYVFIVDVSGSMHGFPLETAKALLRELIGRLRPGDTFNVIPFAGGHSLLHPASVPATEANIARAIGFINRQTGGGGTELLPALRTALAMPSDLGRARTFVVVTDGYVTVEKEAFELIRNNLGQASVFALGIGSSVNRFLIEGLARAGKGEPFFVANPQQARDEATRLRRMIEQPVLTRIRMRFPEVAGGPGFDAYDLDAPQIPDLFAHRPLVLMGKFRGELAGSIEIEGRSAGGAVRLPIDVASAAQADDTLALKYLWARNRIAQLADFNKLMPDDETAREILRLGLAYNLLTDYTSFIAVDKVVRNAGGQSTTVDQPSPLPDGVTELALGSAPATPEPEFFALTLVGGALLWWLRRGRAKAGRAGLRDG